MKILIIKWGALGDVIRTSYILRGLYLKYSHPWICWFTNQEAVDLLRFNPYVSQIITPQSCIKVFQKIVFDLVISLDEEYQVLRELPQLEEYENFIL